MNESTNLDTYGYDLGDPDEYRAFLWQRQFGWMYTQPLEFALIPPRPRPALQRQDALVMEVIEISSSSSSEEDEDNIEIYIDPSIIEGGDDNQ